MRFQTSTSKLALYMQSAHMGPKTQRLIVVLQEMAEILAANARPEWAQWMKRATIQLLNSDYHGVETVLAAYGGMGSLNDVVLAQITAWPSA